MITSNSSMEEIAVHLDDGLTCAESSLEGIVDDMREWVDMNEPFEGEVEGTYAFVDIENLINSYINELQLVIAQTHVTQNDVFDYIRGNRAWRPK